jgi:aspartyl aminopeptidase
MLKTSADSLLDISKKFALEIVEGLNHSVTPFHAVEYCSKKLVDSGFKELNEKYIINIFIIIFLLIIVIILF